MDANINIQWLKGTFVAGAGKEPDEKVLSTDNVGFQRAEKFHQKCRQEVNTVVYSLPENHTDRIQPIDTGC